MIITKRNKNLLSQLFFYSLVGGIAAGVDIGVVYLLNYLHAVPYQIAIVVAFAVGSVVNYSLAIRLVFTSAKRTRRELLLYFLIGVAGLLLNQVLVTFFVELVGFDVLESKVLTVATVFFWNFFFRRLLTNSKLVADSL